MEEIRFLTLGEKIKHFRIFRNMTQGELADKIELSIGTISLWESDKSVPKLDHITRLADILEVPPTLLTDTTITSNKEDLMKALYSIQDKPSQQVKEESSSRSNYDKLQRELVNIIVESKNNSITPRQGLFDYFNYTYGKGDSQNSNYELDDDEISLISIFRQLSDTDRAEILSFANYKYSKVTSDINREIRKANILLSKKDTSVKQIGQILQKLQTLLETMDVDTQDDD